MKKITLYVTFLILLGLDQFSKVLVEKNMVPSETTIPVIKDFFHLTYVQNRGVAFGFLQGKIMLIAIIGIIAIVAIIFFLNQKEDISSKSLFGQVAYAFILAGAFGNLIDRIFRGYVVDFIDFRGIWGYIFNVADVTINVGVGLLIIEYLLVKSKDNKDTEEESE